MELPTSWLFIRGLSREQAHWGDLPTRCEQELGWHCRLIDLAGFGTENHRSSPLNITAIREDLQRRLTGTDDNISEEKIGIIALSLGGMVALDWLANDGEHRISHAVLINSSTADCAFHHRLRPGNVLALLSSLGSRSLKHQERLALSVVSNRDNNADVLAQWCQIRQQRPIQKRNILRQLLAAALFHSPPRRDLAVIPLFVASRADRMVSWKCSDKLARKYRAELRLHNSAGHDLPLDDPEWLIALFREKFASGGDVRASAPHPPQR